MPLIHIQTSIAAPAPTTTTTLLQTLSARLAKHLGKPEAYVMTAFVANVPMTFGGTTEPACYVAIKSVGKMGDRTAAMSQEFCTYLSESLGIPPNRIYIEFTDAVGAMWGWNGQTFG